MTLHYQKSHHNHVGEYQQSSIPFVTSSVADEVTTSAVVTLKLPYVSRWIVIKNTDAAHTLKFGFSANGLSVEFPWVGDKLVEWDKNTKEIVWSWTHPDGRRELRTNREANRLPNGNTLGSASNKLIEIAPDGTIVWQMVTFGGDNKHRKFHKAIRIGTDGKIYGG